MKLVVIIIFVIVMIIMIIITIIIYLFTCWLWAKASHVESRIYNYRIPMNFPRLRLLLISFILGDKWKHIGLGISQLTQLDVF